MIHGCCWIVFRSDDRNGRNDTRSDQNDDWSGQKTFEQSSLDGVFHGVVPSNEYQCHERGPLTHQEY